MATFRQIGRAAADDRRAPPRIEIACDIRALTQTQIAIWDGRTAEKVDKKTGEITEGEDWVWLPRSQLSAADDGVWPPEPRTTRKISMPEWLAKDRGLI